MSPNILLKLERVLNNFQINKEECERFKEVFKHYKKNKWIYPGALYRVTKIKIDIIYNILNQLEQEKILDSYFEVYCAECKKTIGLVYKTIDDIPEEYYCDNCGDSRIAIDYAILIYKVIADE